MNVPVNAPVLADLTVGDLLDPVTYPVRRADLMRYAGASGDFNPIHWSARFATNVGLPDVIAHGMFTMGLVGRYVTDWVGDPGAVVEFGTKFTKPVVVPDTDEGTSVTVSAKLGVIDVEAGTVRVDVTVTCGDEKVLAQTRATVRLA